MKFTIGADPELFLCDVSSVRSVIGKVGGSKEAPRALPLGSGYAVQEDGVAMEFNIPPCGSKREFVTAIAKATGFLEKIMQDQFDLHFDKRSAVSFPDSELYAPAAFEFGCMPDYNAWTKTENPRPKAGDKNLRSAGGHIHIGFEGYDPHEVVKGMDLFAGVPSVMMDHGELRKELYGKAGAFRITPYGVEYRTLSNYWVFQPMLCEWAYDCVERTLAAVRAGQSFDEDRVDILEAIDGNNRKTAHTLAMKHHLDVRL